MKIKFSFSGIKKAVLFLFLCTFSVSENSHAQSLSHIFNAIKKKTSENSGPNLSNSDIASGLKQALEIGAETASKQLSQKNGFFENAEVKILMPPEAQKVASTLRSMGLGSLVDNAILSMNRAAEDAASKAAPIFVNAIRGITIQDGLQILRGGNNAATLYLENKTTPALTAAFSPVIENSLEKTDATRLWKKVFDTYNRIPFIGQKVNPNLTQYVTQQALKGLFTEIAAQELKIRTNPAAQVTDLLKKVFGSLQ